jgi:hypothetical protein
LLQWPRNEDITKALWQSKASNCPQLGHFCRHISSAFGDLKNVSIDDPLCGNDRAISFADFQGR